MSELNDLKNFVLEQRELIDKPGKLLYSSGSTLRHYPIYFLGINPGGELTTTIRQSLDDLDKERNEYLDYSWDGRPPGEHKLQKQIRRFIGGLGFDLRDVPASNIVFTRHKSIQTYPDIDDDASLSWPIHLFMLRMIQPQAIVAYGSGEKASPFAYLKRFLKPIDVQTIHSGQGNFFCHRFLASIEHRPTKIVIVPHLTRYSPYKRADIMHWVKEWISF